MNEKLEHSGLTFRVDIERDEHSDAPWDNSTLHGPVTDWRPVDSQCEHERILAQDRGSARFYVYDTALTLAEKDGWGLSAEDKAALARTLGREPTVAEIHAQAVEKDFDYLRRWCSDDWCYVGVTVTLLDVDGGATSESESLCGIESDAREYLQEVARELAADIAARVGNGPTFTVTRPARTTVYKIRD